MGNKTISIIGVPCDYGQQRRGVDMGPSAIRYAGLQERLELLGFEVVDTGDIPVRKMVAHVKQDDNLLNLEEVVEVSTALANQVADVITQQHMPLVLGGDHSIAIGTLAGLTVNI